MVTHGLLEYARRFASGNKCNAARASPSGNTCNAVRAGSGAAEPPLKVPCVHSALFSGCTDDPPTDFHMALLRQRANKDSDSDPACQTQLRIGETAGLAWKVSAKQTMQQCIVILYTTSHYE